MNEEMRRMRSFKSPEQHSGGATAVLARIVIGIGSGLIVGLVAAVIAISMAAIAYSGDAEV